MLEAKRTILEPKTASQGNIAKIVAMLKITNSDDEVKGALLGLYRALEDDASSSIDAIAEIVQGGGIQAALALVCQRPHGDFIHEAICLILSFSPRESDDWGSNDCVIQIWSGGVVPLLTAAIKNVMSNIHTRDSALELLLKMANVDRNSVLTAGKVYGSLLYSRVHLCHSCQTIFRSK